MASTYRADGRLALAGGTLALLGILVLPLVWSVVHTLPVSGGASEWNLWWPSTWLAARAASVSLIVALLGHWASALYRKKSWIWITFAVTAACALPSYVHALTWSWLLPVAWLAQQPLVAAIVLGFSYAPVSFLVLFAALRAPSRRMLEAAWMTGAPPLRAHLLVARRAVPSLAAAWLIAFLLAFADFPVADHFRVPSYATEVFARVAAWLNVAQAARLALPILVTAVLTTALLARAFSRMSADSGADERAPEEGALIRASRSIAALLFIALVAGIPLMVLIARVPGGEMFRSAVRALQPDIVPTLVLGGAVAVIASALGATLSYIGARNVLASARFGRIVAWAALAWPASLLCLGALSLAAIPLFRLPGFEWLPLVAVLLVRWLVLPHELWWNFWMRVPVSLEEAAWVAGMPWWRALLIVYRRNAVAVFAASVLLTACFVINDLTVFVLLAPPGFSTTTLNVFSAVHYGPSSYLAALTVCQVTAIALLATLAVCLKLGPAHVAR